MLRHEKRVKTANSKIDFSQRNNTQKVTSNVSFKCKSCHLFLTHKYYVIVLKNNVIFAAGLSVCCL